MTQYSTEIEIDAPPERVWAVMRDVERWSEWTPTVRSIRIMGGGPLGAGSRAFVRQPKFPPAMWRITELDDAGRSFTWVSSAPGMRVTARHGVEPSGAGSRARLSIRYEGLFGPLFARLTRAINESYLAMEADGLKRRSLGLV
jgi:carbon monoxide dehydrogenase subunit G